MKKVFLCFVVILLVYPIIDLQAQSTGKFMYEIGLGGSALIRTSNLSPWGVDYRKNYKSGLNMNAKAMYIFNDKTTLGLKYSMFGAAGNYTIGGINTVAENISTHYIAPQAGFILPVNDKFSFSLSVGIGYMFYKNDGLMNNERIDRKEFTIKSNMLAGNVDFSIDYHFEKNMSLSLTISPFSTLYSKSMNRNIDGTKDHYVPEKWNRIDINRIDFGLTYRINF